MKLEQLRQWSDFLDAQIAHFEQEIIREKGRSHVADEISVAFLKTDDDLVKPSIERDVVAFIRDGSWPHLDARESHHLMLRAHCARGAALAVLSGGPVAKAIQAQMPQLNDRDRMIHWLFIESWNLGGNAFIQATTDAFLKRNVRS